MPQSPCPSPSKLERRIVLAVGVLIILALLAMVLLGGPVHPTLDAPLRFLLASASAVLGGFLPGAAFRLQAGGRALAIRTSGAAAFFVLVWLGSPRLASAPSSLLETLAR